jgi:hypothetical protein
MSNKIEFKCSKCGGKRFLVKIWLEIALEVDSITGKIKYEWIDDVKCANLACDQEPSKELKMVLAEKAKTIINALRKEKLEVSISG